MHFRFVLTPETISEIRAYLFLMGRGNRGSYRLHAPAPGAGTPCVAETPVICIVIRKKIVRNMYVNDACVYSGKQCQNPHQKRHLKRNGFLVGSEKNASTRGFTMIFLISTGPGLPDIWGIGKHPRTLSQSRCGRGSM